MTDLQIRHHISRRIRLRIPRLAYQAALADRLVAGLNEHKAVNSVRCNRACAALVIGYQSTHGFDWSSIEAVIRRILGEASSQQIVAVAAGNQARCRRCQSRQSPPALAPQRWWRRLLVFLGLTVYLGYLLVREHLLKRPVASGAVSVTAAVALVAALPLLRDAWHETVIERRFTIHQFLAFSLLLGIGLGEAVTAFEIIYILFGANLLEDAVADRSRRAIRRMLTLSVKDAWVLVEGVELQVPVADLKQHDLVVIRTGSKVPIDGRIEQGHAEVSEAAITGRAEAVYKRAGEAVYAGSFVERGILYVRVEKVGAETYLARIAVLVEEALADKSPMQERADILAARLLRLGTVMTLGTWFVTGSLSRAFTVMLVMSCPCSTILAAATAVSAAIHQATRRQILVKGGVYLERVGQIDCWCFDKTGTLTTETPEVVEVLADDRHALLYWAASAELHNPHPLAQAIMTAARHRGIVLDQHEHSEHILGYGLKASVANRAICLGNLRLMQAEGLDPSPHRVSAERLIERGLTVIYVAVDKTVIGLLGIRHQLRPGVAAALAGLRERGVRHICLVSGDETTVSDGLCRELALDACYSQCLPGEKAEVIERLREQYGAVVMVGDGINDAVALSGADIGIAMGAGGSEVAIEVADIALATSDLRQLVALRHLSHATVRTAEQNYALAVGTDLLGIVLGATGILTPAMGGLIHIAHTLGILANSSRLMISTNLELPSP